MRFGAFFFELRNLFPNALKIVSTPAEALEDNLFDFNIMVGSLKQPEREIFLNFLLNETNHDLNEDKIRDLSLRLASFSLEDLKLLMKIAALRTFQDSQEYLITYKGLKSSILEIKPVNLDSITHQTPAVKWDEIGGYDDVKDLIKLTIELPLKRPEVFAKKGLSIPRGVLFYGPPGCSKTLMARALASESFFNFISIKGPEIFSKYVGDSEKAIRDIFMKAKANSPCIVFFDEIDSIGGKRTASTDVSDRVLIQLLTELDGFEGLNDVIIIGATNRPDTIDDALMRPGRLDELVYIGLPDQPARHSILQIQARKMRFSESVNLEELAQKLDGYTGAEIVQVCRKAGFISVQRNLESEEILQQDLDHARGHVQKRIDSKMINEYMRFKDERK